VPTASASPLTDTLLGVVADRGKLRTRSACPLMQHTGLFRPLILPVRLSLRGGRPNRVAAIPTSVPQPHAA